MPFLQRHERPGAADFDVIAMCAEAQHLERVAPRQTQPQHPLDPQSLEFARLSVAGMSGCDNRAVRKPFTVPARAHGDESDSSSCGGPTARPAREMAPDRPR